MFILSYVVVRLDCSFMFRIAQNYKTKIIVFNSIINIMFLKAKSSRSKCNLSQMLFTPNNLYVKYFILL